MEPTQSYNDSGEDSTVVSQFPPPPPELLTEEENEMVAAERELAEDAQWKKIQQNTFTRWVNEHLKTVNKHCGNLETDLADGLRLIALVEVLSGKKIPRFNKRPMIISQRIENVTIALKFLEIDEGIKLVNIDSSDITDCKLKLILGLIWTLILHYSISLPMWDGEEKGEKGPTPKQRLLGWIQNKIPDLPITNFTTDWNDGRAVGALVDAVAPGLCPDWPDWSPTDALQNATEAMGLADDWLRIPQLIKPEEMIDPNVDELSMMTYLSQYPHAKLQAGAPLRPRTNPGRVRVYGPGVEPTGPVVGAPAPFSIETFAAGKGTPEVSVQGPNGELLPVDLKFNNDRSLTYSASYTPKQEGPHKIVVKFAEKDVPRSPFEVKVEGFAGDASKVTVSGPGVEPNGVIINRPTYFDIFTKEAGKGTPEVAVLDPNGQRSNQVKVRPISQDVWRCEYVTQQLGLHSVNVFFAGKPIPGSPFGVKVAPVSDARRVRAWGRGLQPTGVRVRDTADFKIYTEGAGEGNLDIKIIGPGGVAEAVKIRRIDATTYEAAYQPKKEGRYVVAITYGGREIPRSPFEVNVGPYKESKIVAFGPGLHGGVVGHPALFTVETNGETGALGFSIEGPSQAKIDCQDNNDGSADVRYYPTAPGEYAVHIMCNNEDIPGSPFMANINPSTTLYHPDKVNAYGPGLEKHGVISSRPAEFTVDTRQAGTSDLDISVMDRDYKPVDVAINQSTPGLYQCSYVPKKGVKHTVQVNHGGVAVKNSPFRVFVSDPTDPSKVKVFGPGVERGVKTKSPTHFNIDCRDAGPGEIQVKMVNEKGQDIPMSIIDNQDGSYTVEYTPVMPGKQTVTVLYAGKPVPQSPIQVTVSPHVDVNRVRVEGLEPTITIHALQQFRVLTEYAGSGELALTLTSPSGKKLRPQTIPTKEGYLVNYMPTELGEYTIDATFGGEPLPQFPRKVLCTLPGGQAGQVRAYGAGLLSGTVDKPAEFIIDTRGAGQGGLGVTVEGPCEAAIQCKDNGDGTCAVAYLPTEEGEYAVNITFNDAPIPGSPFQALVRPALDLSKIKVYGPGIQPKGVFVESPTEFVIDPRGVGTGRLQCIVTSPSGARAEAPVTPLADGQQRVTYTPFEEGRHQIDVTYDGVPIAGSPFSVTASRGCDPKKCKAHGPGLLRGIVDQANSFTVETKGAGAGGLGLAIEGPSEARMTCKDNRDGSCTVEYIPLEEGDYDISVKFAEQHIPGSPFKVYADRLADPNAVRAYGPGLDPKNCRAGVPQKFRIDATKSGKAPLSVEVKGDKGQPQQKPEVKDNGDGTYDVTYVPPPEGSNCKIRVTHAGKDIPKSPFEMRVRPKVEPQNVKVTGPGVSSKGVPASLPVDFTIDTTEAGFADLEVQVLGPDGYPCKVKIADNGDGTFRATYVPDDCGQYKVKVKYGGKDVPHAPFPVQAYAIGKADRCQITEGKQNVLTIGEEYCITVNAKQAGHGAVTCKIRSTQGSDLDIDIEDNGDGTFSIYYNVKDAGEYTISVKFGGQPVPDGFYTFTAGEEFAKQSTAATQNHARNNVEDQYRPVELQNIPLPSTGGNVTAEVRMPSGTQDSPMIVDNRDGTVSIRYEPREEGLHELHVKYNNEHVQGSPFKFHVDQISSGLVTAYGPGLTHGICGEQCKFTISTQGAGAAGGLSLAVEGPSKAEISCHDNKDGTVSVSYLPTAPGEYKIAVKFADKHIKGSPYTAKITGEGRRRNQISVGSSSEVPLPGRVTDAELKMLSATIQSPSGIEEPCFLKRLPNGNLGVSFTPREAGEHSVNVKKMGKHIANSPFKISVGEKQVGDARKVKLSGSGLKEGKTHTPNTFKIDTRDAGYGGLSLSIEGPSKAEIDCKDNEDGTLDISYKPTEPGYYIINLKFADHHVDGSPFTVKVTGEGSNKQTERIKKQREAVPITEVGSKCRLQFKLPGVTPKDLSATVASPKGVVEDCSIIPTEDDGFAVDFVPKELGVHTVSVKFKDMHIPGSPFQFTVGPLKESGSHRVRAGGPGLERGEVGESCEFNVWTREAGAGSLAISVEGPSKAEIDFQDRKDGSCYVSYKVTEPGEYRVGIKFNELNIPDSPYRVYITPATGDAHKVEVGQFPENGVRAGKPQAFIVRKCGARGDFDAKVVSPSGVEDDCFISPIVEDETYSVRFVPRENGIHYIHVKFNGIHIPGSPFKVKVGEEDADPAAIKVIGDGITKAVSGQKSEFIIDTTGTGTGTLAVTIDGPSKVSVNCSEVDEGYKVRYTPLLPGEYYISVKYNDVHIPLSPFKVLCTGEKLAEVGVQETSSVVVETVKKYARGQVVTERALPVFKSDASKVACKGMGLKKAYLNKQNTFSVQASDAGNNMLFCGVYGPKGPCEEVFIKHIGRNNYNVNYVTRDRGDYIIVLKWGDEHVPGSPFRVDVV